MADLELTAETLVSEIAARYPATLRTMEALGIDFCCGGGRPLREAAEKAGVPVQAAIAVIQVAAAPGAGAPAEERNWADAPLDALMDHIVETHHAYLHSEMPRLEGMLTLVARVHGPNHGDVLQPMVGHYAALKADLEAHLAREEEEVFPAVAKMLAGASRNGVAESLAELAAEHDAAGELLAALRADSRGYEVPEDACATYRALYDGIQALEQDLHRHIHLENNALFPRALARAQGR